MTIVTAMLKPVLALVTWTHVIWFSMYWTRIPAILSSRMKLDGHAPRGEQMNTLPSSVRWKADNYNHLLEHPTLFYAVCITLAVIGVEDTWSLVFAWGYVVIRVLHSLVQTLVNHIPTRFALFVLSSLASMALTVQAARALW
jgi:hypothetical protein